MTSLRLLLLALLACAPLAPAIAAESAPQAAASSLKITPAAVTLQGQGAQHRLLVTGELNGRQFDLTRKATFSSLAPEVVSVNSQGVVSGIADGTGEIRIEADGQQAKVAVTVRGAHQPRPVSFELDVMPILTRQGCNAGACHGKARGQNGFALSLLGFDNDFDYAALTTESRGRRVSTVAPDNSLLLQKATAAVPHGGGKRMEPAGAGYDTVRRWIEQGIPRETPNTPALTAVNVFPQERIMGQNEEQQLLVTATYSDGSVRDVTALAAFQSNESVIAAVEPDGLIKSGPLPGEAAVMARFMGQIAICSVLLPLPGDVPAEFYASLPRQNFIDSLVWDKLQRLKLTPSAPASETTWLRRVHLDVIGRLPTPEEIRAFLADKSPDKRSKVIDGLLARHEYGDFWANKWADLLRPNPYRVGIKAVFNYDAWIRESFRKNKPYDQFVRELITAQGSTYQNGAVTMFRDRRTPDEITTIVSQLFLGIRLECAKCHHHPFEKYGQEDFYSFAAYFARIGHKGVGLSPPISGSEEIIMNAVKGEVSHPLTGTVLPPRPLFGDAPPITGETERREALTKWVTAPENTYFAQVMSNRVWGDIMGRGLVEPVDDLRATNPATNPPLLAALAADFRDHDFDIKHLIRTIVSSYVYGLSSIPGDRNLTDNFNYSRHYRRRLRGETLLDGVCDITQVPEEFAAMPAGSRATELWTHRSGSLFLDAFGRPDPNQDPPCERNSETTVIQTLHLMNSPKLHAKVTASSGRTAALASSDRSPAELVEELYLLVYARLPKPAELAYAVGLFTEEKAERKKVVEDLMWALINTPEFIFKN